MDVSSFSNYAVDGFYDEMISSDHPIRNYYQEFCRELDQISTKSCFANNAAERSLHSMGITFNVYFEGEGVERGSGAPHIIPRITPLNDRNGIGWKQGLIQRITALNLFIDDDFIMIRRSSRMAFVPESVDRFQ
ncbi:MAG: hypothetical protein R2824_22855 [Saprospiraceae bacterium]